MGGQRKDLMFHIREDCLEEVRPEVGLGNTWKVKLRWLDHKKSGCCRTHNCPEIPLEMALGVAPRPSLLGLGPSPGHC